MAPPALAPEPDHGPVEIPVTPSAERWRAMSRAERDAHLADALDALQREAWLSPEGLPHATARAGALSVLSDHFHRAGRRVFLAADLPVHYPDERPFAPDVLAVCDADAPDYDDPRMAWVVADEGRGLDWVLEVAHAGDRDKDLVTNVARYARLGIPEYFVYDRRRQRLYGYRLPDGGGRAYETIPARGGKMPSDALGLDLGIVEGRLRFFSGDAVAAEARELIGRLGRSPPGRRRRPAPRPPRPAPRPRPGRARSSRPASRPSSPSARAADAGGQPQRPSMFALSVGLGRIAAATLPWSGWK